MVPVVDKNQIPLMPCSEKRARKMINSKKATPFWKRGIFCIRLNKEPLSREYQKIAVGVDPGSKKEGFTIKSEAHTLLNIQADAVTWVKERIETKRNARNSRRSRNTPCRKNRYNRSSLTKKDRIPPSTKARWGWKLRILSWLKKMYPITNIVIEDIKAMTKKGKRRWNVLFSPLEIGKKWFYNEAKKLGELSLREGWETKNLRDFFGLKKSSQKLSNKFEAHCVDSWVLANENVGGHLEPENKKILFLVPFKFYKRMLHKMLPKKGGKRSPFGGTRSLGFKRGSLVKHSKYGLFYIGGTTFKNRISLHSLNNGKRLCQKIKISDLKFLTFSSWRSFN
jgi:hypothetical protein